MELAEESEHQRMGIFPSKAKVTAQGPWQTMEVFIRSSAPSPVNVCENVEKQSWPWYQQANSVLEKITVQSQSQWPQCISNFSCPSQNQAAHVSWTTQSQLTGFQGSSCRRQCLRVSHVSMYTHTDIPHADFWGFQETCTHTKCCQCEPKPPNPSSRKEYTLCHCWSSRQQLITTALGIYRSLKSQEVLPSCCCLRKNQAMISISYTRISWIGRCPWFKTESKPAVGKISSSQHQAATAPSPQ